MVAAIVVLGLFLLLSGSTGLVLSATLMPTELGFAYFQAGAIAASAGVITLAIACATRHIDKLAARFTPVAPSRAEAPVSIAAERSDLPVSPPVSSVRQPDLHEQITHVDSVTPHGNLAATSVAAVAVAGAGAIAAMSTLAEKSDSALPESEEPSPAALQPDLFPEPEIDHAPDPEMDSKLVELILHPEPVTPENAAALEIVEEEEEVQAPAVSEAETVPAPEVTLPSAPGLIPDADLLSLEQTEAPLAPIETLEVVGSYDSGGTRFTMYSDGSVTAIGPEGERRFASLDLLRRHLDTSSG
ncbi:MAG: hypothetical protein LCH38_14605 [Proteobacteria bacterium]|nr:hypothetical protein [Pseudomonadota bacterium]